jgi:hypothetical protein
MALEAWSFWLKCATRSKPNILMSTATAGAGQLVSPSYTTKVVRASSPSHNGRKVWSGGTTLDAYSDFRLEQTKSFLSQFPASLNFCPALGSLAALNSLNSKCITREDLRQIELHIHKSCSRERCRHPDLLGSHQII